MNRKQLLFSLGSLLTLPALSEANKPTEVKVEPYAIHASKVVNKDVITGKKNSAHHVKYMVFAGKDTIIAYTLLSVTEIKNNELIVDENAYITWVTYKDFTTHHEDGGISLSAERIDKTEDWPGDYRFKHTDFRSRLKEYNLPETFFQYLEACNLYVDKEIERFMVKV